MKSKGFTLIEIMIVIFILALVTSIAVFSIRVPQSTHSIETFTQNLSHQLNIAHSKAVFNQNQIGFNLTDSGYRFYTRPHLQAEWKRVKNDKSLSPLKKDPEISIALNSTQIESFNNFPMLVFSQSEMPSFSISLSQGEIKTYITVNPQGEISWQ